jgi:hypothetical protein
LRPDVHRDGTGGLRVLRAVAVVAVIIAVIPIIVTIIAVPVAVTIVAVVAIIAGGGTGGARSRSRGQGGRRRSAFSREGREGLVLKERMATGVEESGVVLVLAIELEIASVICHIGLEVVSGPARGRCLVGNGKALNGCDGEEESRSDSGEGNHGKLVERDSVN